MKTFQASAILPQTKVCCMHAVRALLSRSEHCLLHCAYCKTLTNRCTPIRALSNEQSALLEALPGKAAACQ